MPEVTMPRLSDTMQEGTLARWLKQPGEKVEKGEPLAEIETDKATMELESYDSGVLEKVLVQEASRSPWSEPARRRPAGRRPAGTRGRGDAETPGRPSPRRPRRRPRPARTRSAPPSRPPRPSRRRSSARSGRRRHPPRASGQLRPARAVSPAQTALLHRPPGPSTTAR